jgi:hypothetical protein
MTAFPGSHGPYETPTSLVKSELKSSRVDSFSWHAIADMWFIEE